MGYRFGAGLRNRDQGGERDEGGQQPTNHGVPCAATEIADTVATPSCGTNSSSSTPSVTATVNSLSSAVFRPASAATSSPASIRCRSALTLKMPAPGRSGEAN